MVINELKYADHKGHVTNEMLNVGYGKYGKTFKKESDARKFAKDNNSFVTRLFDYNRSDIEKIHGNGGYRIKVKEGAIRHYGDWLVSLWP